MPLRQDAEASVTKLKQLERHLQRWQHACVLCLAKRNERETHLWQQCTFYPIHSTFMEYRIEMLSQIGCKPNSCCDSCLAPQTICERWVEKNKDGLFQDRGSSLCQYKDVLIPAVAALHFTYIESFKNWIRPFLAQTGLPVRPVYRENVLIVLGQLVDFGQHRANRLTAFFHAWNEGLVPRVEAP